MLGVSVKRLQHWDREGKLKAYRTSSDRRHYTQKQYVDYIRASKPEGKNNHYARISTTNQKDDLKNQLEKEN